MDLRFMVKDSNKEVFFELLRAGLWEKEVRLSPNKDIDYSSILKLAEEQSVVGLVAAGLEHVMDVKVPQQWALRFASQAMQLEQWNKAMNVFVAKLISKLREKDIYTLLVKGQGIAQCYERPLWRACGDVDLLLNSEDYENAKSFLALIADSDEEEVEYRLHKAYHINGYEVELHGNLRGRFLRRVDKVIDEVQRDAFDNHTRRVWNNGGVDVLLPSPDCDVFFVFTHILQHFFIEGVGLRQICDWCRLLFTYRDSFNHELLKSRLNKAGIMTEWKAFAALTVEYLGMPVDAMPFYDSRFKIKGEKVMGFVFKTGNFGHNRHANETYKYPVVVRKTISFCRHTCDGFRFFRMFPLDAVKIWIQMIGAGLHVAVKGL